LSNAQTRDPIVLAVSGASAQPLAERALQLLLQAEERVEVVVSRGAIGVWQAELGVRVPSEPDAQEQFWRARTGCRSGSLRCHRWRLFSLPLLLMMINSSHILMNNAFEV